jgi:hypothetical protein
MLWPESELQKQLVAPGNSFFQFWGLNQSWRLFAPTIREINYHTTATITFDDGAIMLWQMPRMDRLDLGHRFVLEKFRKWAVDTLPWPSYKEYWVDYAHYAGRVFATPQRKPVQFSLHLFCAKIPPPVGNLVDRYQLPPHEDSSLVFTYFYKPEDFQ